jgi:hypothetical protein
MTTRTKCILWIGGLVVLANLIALDSLTRSIGDAQLAAYAGERLRCPSCAPRLPVSEATSEIVRPSPPEAVEMRRAARGETAPVKHLAIGEYDPTQPEPPPNPFVEPKKILTTEEAGID